jgi:hypothetical protein
VDVIVVQLRALASVGGNGLGRDMSEWSEDWRWARQNAIQALRFGGYVLTGCEVSERYRANAVRQISETLEHLNVQELVALDMMINSLAGPSG